MKLRLLNISNNNVNATVLLKMRGPPTYGEVPFPKYGIFLHFQPFSAILGKMAVFGDGPEVSSIPCLELQ